MSYATNTTQTEWEVKMSVDVEEDIRAVCLASGVECSKILFERAHTVNGVTIPPSLYLEIVYPNGDVGNVGGEIDLTRWSEERKAVLMDVNIMIHGPMDMITSKGGK